MHAARPVEALPISKPQRASRLRGASQVEAPAESQLVLRIEAAVAQRPEWRRPWRPAASNNPRSAFGTRIRDALRASELLNA
jgi:hypothetical protein